MIELTTAWMLGCVSGFFMGVTVAGRRRPTCRELMRDPDRQPTFADLLMPKRSEPDPPELFVRLDEGRVQRGNGGNNPTTQKPDTIPKPQPPPGRIIDAFGQTIGYKPLPWVQGLTKPPHLITMTNNNQHPITPPPELVEQLRKEAPHGIRDAGVTRELHLIIAAYRAGADQELEACCEWLNFYAADVDARDLRTARRPKPPSLKEQALEALDQADKGLNEFEWQQRSDTIRRALESLPE